MADFFQTGAIATLHRLGPPDLDGLERQLEEFTRECPVALVLPCHASELGSPALEKILDVVSGIRYLAQVVAGIDGASPAQWELAKSVFSRLPQATTLLWNDGPAVAEVLRRLEAADIYPGQQGKGRNLWLCAGFVLACGKARSIAVHDCDITTYSRELLARICYPVAHPNFGFDFCKGYSARYTDRLNGRVMRLMFTPLIRSLESILGAHHFLKFMDSFRYPLAGEACFDLDVVRRSEIPSDWGVEVGMLAEVFRVLAPKSICQVEFSERYDHKHQDLSAEDPTKGLSKMAFDIAKCIFLAMAGHGIKLDKGIFDALLTTYLRESHEAMRFYEADAMINGLRYERHDEEVAAGVFARSIRRAANAYLEDPFGNPMIPGWNRVVSALPEIYPMLLEASTPANKEAHLAADTAQRATG